MVRFLMEFGSQKPRKMTSECRVMSIIPALESWDKGSRANILARPATSESPGFS